MPLRKGKHRGDAANICLDIGAARGPVGRAAGTVEDMGNAAYRCSERWVVKGRAKLSTQNVLARPLLDKRRRPRQNGDSRSLGEQLLNQPAPQEAAGPGYQCMH